MHCCSGQSSKLRLCCGVDGSVGRARTRERKRGVSAQADCVERKRWDFNQQLGSVARAAVPQSKRESEKLSIDPWPNTLSTAKHPKTERCLTSCHIKAALETMYSHWLTCSVAEHYVVLCLCSRDYQECSRKHFYPLLVPNFSWKPQSHFWHQWCLALAVSVLCNSVIGDNL